MLKEKMAIDIDSNEGASFSEVLKDYRTARHLTQQQLADRLGVRRNTVGSWERGDFLPNSKAIVLELAKHLHLDEQETRLLLETSLTALAPHLLVPLPRNPFFTGRDEILKALHAQLGIDRAAAFTQSMALHGLGGIGKTQIALEYAYRYALEYSAVFWVRAESSETIIASLLGIAEAVQMPARDDPDQQRVITAVQRWLSTHSKWLLIWDNVEDLKLLRRFLPSTRSGAMLITTRLQSLGTLAQSLELLPMELEEGVLFLLRRAKVLTQEASEEQMRQFAVRRPEQYVAAIGLVETLGGLPLALDQAGAYVEETRCGLPAYLELFRNRRTELLRQRGEHVYEHPSSASATFTLALTATASRHPAVRDLLCVCACLQPGAMPEELFRQGGKYLGAALEAAGGEVLEWNRLVGVACSYSLLSRQPDEETLSLHRLVQAVLLDSMNNEERAQWSARVIEALNAVFPVAEFDSSRIRLHQCERLLPHALHVLQQAGKVGETLILASLASKTAYYLHLHRRYGEAEPLYQRALRIQEQTLGPVHPDVAQTLASLGGLFYGLGKYKQAEPFWQRALFIQEQALGPEHPQLANTFSGLGTLSLTLGYYTQARAFLQRARALWEHAFGSEHPGVATMLGNLAVLAQMQGDYTRAESLYRRALPTLEHTLGAESPSLATMLNGLALLSLMQDNYEQAQTLWARVFSIWERILGAEYARVAPPPENLPDLSQAQARNVQAERLWQRALTIWIWNLGSSRPNPARVLNHLAGLYHAQGQYEQAEALYRQALAIMQQMFDSEHLVTAAARCNLAILAHVQGKYEQAEALYQRALSIWERALTPEHPLVAEALEGLADLYQAQSRYEQAQACSRRALSIRMQSPGDAHPKIVATREVPGRKTPTREISTRLSIPDVKTSPREVFLETANDPLHAFLDACCELHPLAWCRISELWRTYEQWTASYQKRVPLSRRAFAEQLKMRGCRADRTNRERIWRGIRLVKKDR